MADIKVKQTSNVKLRKWFIERKAEEDKERLFIFHHAGGGATFYMPMLKDLIDKYSVYFVQLPGREYRIEEPVYKDWDSLIEDVKEQLLPYFDKPFVLFGHSMGAIIAYELSCRLDEMGIRPKHLFISSISSPDVPKKKYSGLPDDVIIDDLLDLGGMDSEVVANNKLISMVLPTLKNDLYLCEKYKHKVYKKLNIPTTILIGNSDKVISMEDVANWNQFFEGKLDYKIFQGNHFYFRNKYSELANVLSTT